jgi:hypothetical protein
MTFFNQEVPSGTGLAAASIVSSLLAGPAGWANESAGIKDAVSGAAVSHCPSVCAATQQARRAIRGLYRMAGSSSVSGINVDGVKLSEAWLKLRHCCTPLIEPIKVCSAV